MCTDYLIRHAKAFLLVLSIQLLLFPEPVSRSAGAWNDPPMLKKKAPVAHSVTSQKITNPVAAPPNQGSVFNY